MVGGVADGWEGGEPGSGISLTRVLTLWGSVVDRWVGGLWGGEGPLIGLSQLRDTL